MEIQSAINDSSCYRLTYQPARDAGPDADIFGARLSAVHHPLPTLGRDAGMAGVDVTVVLTRDFRGQVNRLLQSTSERDGTVHQEYAVERIGGVAVAKNVPTEPDGSAITIFVNADVIDFSTPAADIHSTFLIAHELVHPIQNRVRDASGVVDGVQFPSRTAAETSRSIVRVAADEYRADRLAHVIVKHVMRPAGADGQELQPVDYFPQGYGAGVTAASGSSIYPGWPDLVDEYRNWRLTLDAMIGTIWTQTDQLVTAAAHAEAEREVFAIDEPIFASAQPEARKLYLEPMWQPIRELITTQPLLPSVAELKQTEPVLLETAERSIRAMWAKLGLHFADQPDRGMRVDVEAPAR